MNEKVMKVISAFDNAPQTEEKKKIQSQYIRDEISCYDLFGKAEDYLEKHNIKVEAE